MRVPITEMPNVGMTFFNRPKELFLVLAILKETGRGSLRFWTWWDNSQHLNVVVGPFLAIRPDESAAGFVDVVLVALIVYGFQRSSGYRKEKMAFFDLNIGCAPHRANRALFLRTEFNSLKLKMFLEWMDRTIAPHDVILIQ